MCVCVYVRVYVCVKEREITFIFIIHPCYIRRVKIFVVQIELSSFSLEEDETFLFSGVLDVVVVVAALVFANTLARLRMLTTQMIQFFFKLF